MNPKRKTLKIAALIAAFTITASMPMPMQRISILSGTFTACAADTENPVQGKEGPLSYMKYSDHVVISSCDMSATSVEIPEAIEGQPVTEIGTYAFTMTGMTSIVIPNSIKEIGNYAFSMCSSLKSVTLSDSIEKSRYQGF